MNHIFLVNPNSGTFEKNKSVLNEIKAICERHGLEYKIHITESEHDMRSLAWRYSSTMHDKVTLYAVGGDGSFHAILNAMDLTVPISIIPTGSGNDIYRTFCNHEKSLEERILSNMFSLVDVGQVNDRLFLNIASVGIDADINDAMIQNREKHFLSASVRYKLEALKKIMSFEAYHLFLQYLDQQVQKEFTLITVCNGSTYGGGIKIAPNADVTDGYFDCIIAGALKRMEMIELFLKIQRQTHLEDKRINVVRCSDIKIESEKNLICNVDGESLSGKNFKFTIKKKALRLKP